MWLKCHWGICMILFKSFSKCFKVGLFIYSWAGGEQHAKHKFFRCIFVNMSSFDFFFFQYKCKRSYNVCDWQKGNDTREKWSRANSSLPPAGGVLVHFSVHETQHDKLAFNSMYMSHSKCHSNVKREGTAVTGFVRVRASNRVWHFILTCSLVTSNKPDVITVISLNGNNYKAWTFLCH